MHGSCSGERERTCFSPRLVVHDFERCTERSEGSTTTRARGTERTERHLNPATAIDAREPITLPADGSGGVCGISGYHAHPTVLNDIVSRLTCSRRCTQCVDKSIMPRVAHVGPGWRSSSQNVAQGKRH
jgi:hypothetical protein